MTRIKIEIDEKDLKQLVLKYLSEKVGADLTMSDIIIETKSVQNYKATWEVAAFRAIVERVINDPTGV